MARSVVDLAVLLDATAGLDPADPTTAAVDHSFVEAVRPDGVAGRRVGVLRFEAGPPVDDSLRAALAEMAGNGAQLVEVVLPPSPVEVNPFFDEFRFALGGYLAARPYAPVRSLDEILEAEPFDAGVTPRLREFAAVPTLDEQVHARSVRQRGAWRDTLVAFMDGERLDAVAYPVSTTVAALVDGQQDHFDCTISAISGLPAIVPAGFTSDGLPVGLELIGRPCDESMLVSIAAGFEANTDHRRLPSSTPPLEPAP